MSKNADRKGLFGQLQPYRLRPVGGADRVNHLWAIVAPCVVPSRRRLTRNEFFSLRVFCVLVQCFYRRAETRETRRLKSLFEEQAKKRQQAGAANGGSKTEDDYQRSAGVTNVEKKVVPNLAPSPDSGKSRDKAAAVVNVSHGSIDNASRVIERGAPELVQAVEQGKIAVSTASGSLSALRLRRNSRRWVSAGAGLKRRVRILVANATNY